MIGEIENAILMRLNDAGDKNALGYKFAHLSSYPDDWDQWLKETLIKFPAAWVVFGGCDAGDFVQGKGAKAEASFVVLVAAQNLRNERSQRHGGMTSNEVGSYQLVSDVVSLLNGHKCGLDIAPLIFKSVRLVRPDATIRERKLSVWALHFTTNFYFDIVYFEPDHEFIGKLADIQVGWDAAPKNGVIALSQSTTLPTEEA